MSRPIHVGGQAVVEGVMMRAPQATAVAVRKGDGSIVARIRRSKSVTEGRPWLKRPGLRGIAVLIETLSDGISALNFSAEQAMTDEERRRAGGEAAIVATLVFSIAFAFFMFALAPHFITNAIGWLFGSESLMEGRAALFHLVDGIVKTLLFLGFVWGVSRLKDMRRVFQYHGAEHQAVHTFEAGLELTVENLSRFPTAHARCGTAFLVTVIVVSILVFTSVFPLLPELSQNRLINQALYVLIKAPLILPIAGLSYEIIKFAGNRSGTLLGRILSAPGVWFQKITTQHPDASQQEIAIVALTLALNPQLDGSDQQVLNFVSFDNFLSTKAGA